LVYMCTVCYGVRLWPTAWGLVPHLKCDNDCGAVDDMEVADKVPVGCLYVFEEIGEPVKRLMGVDFTDGRRSTSTYTWLNEEGRTERETVGQPGGNVLIVVGERMESREVD